METPQLFGTFHIIASLSAAVLAVMAAAFFARRIKNEKQVCRILAATGWILIILEVYKQFFLYYVVNGGAFDFWFFPFQLCSVPMYLCVILPAFREKARVTMMTFMGGYTFVSALATLIYPEDILRPYITMTAHGFIWHAILLFISLLIFMTGTADASAAGLARAALLVAALSVVALMINIAVEPVMQTGSAAHRYAAMFYLNPYHLSPQPIISDIQKAAGIPAGLLIYSIVTAIAGSLATVVAAKLSD
jgi:uncharacterized membrane protein YwaF